MENQNRILKCSSCPFEISEFSIFNYIDENSDEVFTGESPILVLADKLKVKKMCCRLLFFDSRVYKYMRDSKIMWSKITYGPDHDEKPFTELDFFIETEYIDENNVEDMERVEKFYQM